LLGKKQVNFKKKNKKIFLIISFGQIGDGTSGTDGLFPVTVDNSGVLSGKKIIQISSGNYHTCVIANDSNSYCWGSNGFLNK
jgi:alpha-tubulin suppressor-like RCC1 family protein